MHGKFCRKCLYIVKRVYLSLSPSLHRNILYIVYILVYPRTGARLVYCRSVSHKFLTSYTRHNFYVLIHDAEQTKKKKFICINIVHDIVLSFFHKYFLFYFYLKCIFFVEKIVLDALRQTSGFIDHSLYAIFFWEKYLFSKKGYFCAE